MKSIFKNRFFALLLTLTSAAFFASPSYATYTIEITESSGDVMATGSGSIDLTGMTALNSANPFAWMGASFGSILIGDNSADNYMNDLYSTVTGPASFGTGFAYADAVTGPLVGFNPPGLYVPVGYQSNTPLGTSTATWIGQTLATLGVVPGNYTYTLPSGDTIIINAIAAPPNAAPVASAVLINGTPPLVGQPLTGSYTYSDTEGDLENVAGTTFRWVRSDSSAGIGIGTETQDSNTKNYTPVGADQGSYLYFCVTPAAQTGTSPGSEACSSASASVGAAPTPTLSAPTATGYANLANFSFQANYDSSIFFTVIPGAGTCPAAATIETHTGSPLYWGSTTVLATMSKPYALRNLAQSTSYKLCAVAKANGSTNYSAVQTMALSTVAGAAVNSASWANVGAKGGAGTSGMVSPSRPKTPQQKLAMAIASDGNPYMVYYDSSPGFGYVRKFDGSTWADVGGSIYAMSYPAIAIAPDDTPYLIFRDGSYPIASGFRASVMKFDGTSWVNVGSAGFTAGRADDPSIALAPDGTPYVVYGDQSGNLIVQKFDGTSWVSVGATGMTSNTHALVFGPDGLPYVASDGRNYKASVIKYNGSSWVDVGAPGFSADYINLIAIAVAPDGKLLVSYNEANGSYPQQNLTVMKFDGSSWALQGPRGMSPAGTQQANVAFGPTGGVYVGYPDQAASTAPSVQTFDGSNWNYVGAQGFSGSSTSSFFSMAFDRNGWLYAGIYDNTGVYPGMMKTVPPPASAPTASNVTITGTAQVGLQLTGSYTYGDVNGDLEDTSGSGSSYRFVRSTDNSVTTTGDNVNAATGTTGGVGQTYTLSLADQGKYLFYCVTPKTTTGGLLTGAEVCSSASAAVVVAANAAPVASNVAITGTARASVQLTGSYTYFDAENNPQGTSTFRWMSDTQVSGATKAAIGSATALTYTPVAGDLGKYLFFCVTPVATSGTSPGTEACSSATAAVAAAAVNGACGVVTATAFVPTTGLCTNGTAPASATPGSPWTWSCTGSNGGTTASCTAPNATTATGSGAGRALVAATNGWIVDAANSGFVSTGSLSGSPSLPPGYTFPHGLMKLRLINGTAGTSATVTITYPAALPAGTSYWKYGRTPSNPTAHWYQFPSAAIAGNTITLTLTDGADGDDDMVANSVIADPGGPVVPVGGGTGSIPTLSEWGVIILSALLAMLGLWQVRRREVRSLL